MLPQASNTRQTSPWRQAVSQVLSQKPPKLPNWSTSDEKEIAQGLLKLRWCWIPHAQPVEGWEEKHCSPHGWQLWVCPSVTAIYPTRNDALFGLCLEAYDPELDFNSELKKAQKVIAEGVKRQKARISQQLPMSGLTK